MIKKVNAYYIFAVIFVLYYIPRYIEYTTFIKIDEIKLIVTFTKLISYMLAFSYIVYKVVQKKSISLLLSTIMLFFLFQSFLGERKSVFVVLLFSTIFEEEYMDKYIRSLFNISVVLYVITFISSKAGIIENVITSRDKLGGAWIAGGNGFEYPGQMIMMLMPIVFMYYYLKSGKITWKDNVFWLVVDAFIFSQCLTITGTVMIALFIACYNVLQYTKKTKDSKILASGIIKFLPFIFLLASLIGLITSVPHCSPLWDGCKGSPACLASHMRRTDTSAGLTPLIREACPTFPGRIRFSFSCASERRPVISI